MTDPRIAFALACERAKLACEAGISEMLRALDEINRDRAARGVAPLEIEITSPTINLRLKGPKEDGTV